MLNYHKHYHKHLHARDQNCKVWLVGCVFGWHYLHHNYCQPCLLWQFLVRDTCIKFLTQETSARIFITCSPRKLAVYLMCVQIIYIEAVDGSEDLIVLNPQWLCCDVIGQLLSHDQVTRCRPIGRFSLDEVHVMFPESSVVKLVSLLQTMELCSAVVEDSETVEFEFMSLNFVESSDQFVNYADDNGLEIQQTAWVYGGVRLVGSRGIGLQLTSVFPRVQTRLHRQLDAVMDSEHCDLDQWYGGSRLTTHGGLVQVILSASVDCHVIDIKCRATLGWRLAAFRLLASICHLVTNVLADCLPSLAIEQQTLSVTDLSKPNSGKPNSGVVSAYSSRDVRQMLDCYSRNDTSSDASENIVDLTAFGSADIFSALTPSASLPLSVGLSVDTRRAVAKLLDQPPSDRTRLVHVGRTNRPRLQGVRVHGLQSVGIQSDWSLFSIVDSTRWRQCDSVVTGNKTVDSWPTWRSRPPTIWTTSLHI